MSDPFLGEIRLMSFGFPPKGWTLCNGQLLPINQNQALFSLLGTTYGGDGRINFALPNLQGRVPAHVGNGLTLGESAGEASHTLGLSELPQHNHALQANSGAGTNGAPSNARVLAQSTGAALYGAPTNVVSMLSTALSSVGGSQPHENMQPYLVLSFCIALQGIFPSRS